MPKYLKITLSIIITSVVLPIILFGTCISASSSLQSILAFAFLISLIVAPIAIAGSLIAILICYIKNRREKPDA